MDPSDPRIRAGAPGGPAPTTPPGGGRRAFVVWLGVVVAAATLLVSIQGPWRAARRCVRLYETAERERAHVLHKLGHATLVLQIVEGSHAGLSCTADTTEALYEAARIGDVREVVHLDDRPGDCELASTIEASSRFLRIFDATVAAVLIGMAGLGFLLNRLLDRVALARRRPPADVQTEEVQTVRGAVPRS